MNYEERDIGKSEMEVIMTDNFDRYREFIRRCGDLPDDNEKGNLDKYYVVELMRRGKDNPDLPAANYHFRNYYIYSWHDLDRREQEIKDVCQLLRLRAYCSVNYKLMSQVALDALAESARRIAAHDYKKYYNIFESCSGKFVNHGDAKWIIDLDDDLIIDPYNGDFVVQMINYINDMKSGHDKNIISIMPTRAGLHFITYPFNLQQFNTGFWDKFTGVFSKIPDVKKNHLTLLYEDL